MMAIPPSNASMQFSTIIFTIAVLVIAQSATFGCECGTVVENRNHQRPPHYQPLIDQINDLIDRDPLPPLPVCSDSNDVSIPYRRSAIGVQRSTAARQEQYDEGLDLDTIERQVGQLLTELLGKEGFSKGKAGETFAKQIRDKSIYQRAKRFLGRSSFQFKQPSRIDVHRG
uniref:Uncharacterized protein n=1 Tax=Spongospora subterranea TaxID=70186 RepID=A0A0H5R0D7_9EUKA|eukprot:CRZ07446.1 hypothetical protein [Spongospora subterranea]